MENSHFMVENSLVTPNDKYKFSPLDLLFCLLFGLGDFFRDG